MADGTQPIWGEIWIENDKITYAGAPRASDIHWDVTRNLCGNLVLPGFKNAHTHSAMTFLRSYADDLPLHDWLNRQVFPMEAKLNEEHIYHLSKLAILEYLTSGITANFDMYLTPDSIAQASIDCGFRTVLTGAVNDFSQSAALVGAWYEKYNGYHPLISFELGFHAEYTTSRGILEELAALAARYRAPVYTHNSETASEVQACIQKNGCTPTQYLDALHLFDYGGGGYHCVYLTPEDMEIFRRRGLSVITNPASNLKLASGIAPIQALLDAGINLAIGTDGPASNNCLDMFREMFLTTALAKVREQNAAAVDADAVLYMATVGGAKAMRLTDCETLTPGSQADLIVLDLNQPNMQPLNNISKNIVYSGSKQNVALTMVAGKILYENGTFDIGEDPQAIYAQANEIIRQLAAR
ncbi:MAG TPA: amidohydrolase [Candidatus Butyricicoccus stercorigallinarum]|nr:amidohydrolase [Candidatus Butyricicoccus stercorigallinarum]